MLWSYRVNLLEMNDGLQIFYHSSNLQIIVIRNNDKKKGSVFKTQNSS